MTFEPVKEYLHLPCRTRTFAPARQAEPRPGGLQWCNHCQKHFPLAEFSKIQPPKEK